MLPPCQVPQASRLYETDRRRGRQPRSEEDFIDGAGYELASTLQDCPQSLGSGREDWRSIDGPSSPRGSYPQDSTEKLTVARAQLTTGWG